MTENKTNNQSATNASQEKQDELDNLEMLNLIAKSTTNIAQGLDNIDKDVNGVGHQVVDIHKESQDLADQLTKQTNGLKNIKQSQENVQRTSEELIKNVDATNKAFKNNDKILNQIDSTLKTNETNTESRHKVLIKTFDNLSAENKDGIKQVLGKVTNIKDDLTKIDIKKDMATIDKNVGNTNSLLAHLTSAEAQHNTENAKHFETVNKRIDGMIDKLAKVSEHADNLTKSVDKVDAHLQSIHMQMNAIGESAGVDFTKTEKSSKDEKKNEISKDKKPVSNEVSGPKQDLHADGQKPVADEASKNIKHNNK